MTTERWRQIREQAARDPATRADVLAAADPELRGEVEVLLAKDSPKTAILDQAPYGGAANLAGRGLQEL